MIADHSHCAGRNRSIDKARAVGLAAGEREEEIAGLDHAAVERNAAHVERCDSGLDRGIIAQKILA
jgi:hypothetical protein